MYGCLLQGLSIALLSSCILFPCLSRAEEESAIKECYYGDLLLPEKVFTKFIGWTCFEEASKETTTIHVCRYYEDEFFKIPCFKKNGRYITFDVSDPRKLKEISIALSSREENQIFLECYFVNSMCDSNNSTPISRLWLPDSDPSACDASEPSKFHVAMLSISLIFGVPACIILAYFCWKKNNILFTLHLILIVSLTIRSFFTLLIQTDIVLSDFEGSTVVQENGAGCQTLAVFETFFLNLVLGFWLVESIYLRLYFQAKDKAAKSIRFYFYTMLGASFVMTTIWIIVMATSHNEDCWIGVRSWVQWINDPLRIFFIICQIFVLANVLQKTIANSEESSDNSIRKEILIVFILTPLFVLQFCLHAAVPTGSECYEAFFYTFYFIDGTQCAFTSLLLFYIDKEVLSRIFELFGINKNKQDKRAEQRIKTLDSLCERKNASQSGDIVYSSVLTPDQYEKTMELYQKFNLVPTNSVTIHGDEKFLDCRDRSMSTVTEYYDAESYTEYFDPIQSQNDLTVIKEETIQKKAVTPIMHSKYATVTLSVPKGKKIACDNRDSSGSSDASSQVSTTVSDSTALMNQKPKEVPKIVLIGFDGTEINDNESDTTSTSSDEEHIENLPQARKVSVSTISSDDIIPPRNIRVYQEEGHSSFDSKTAVMGSSESEAESVKKLNENPMIIDPSSVLVNKDGVIVADNIPTKEEKKNLTYKWVSKGSSSSIESSHDEDLKSLSKSHKDFLDANDSDADHSAKDWQSVTADKGSITSTDSEDDEKTIKTRRFIRRGNERSSGSSTSVSSSLESEDDVKYSEEDDSDVKDTAGDSDKHYAKSTIESTAQPTNSREVDDMANYNDKNIEQNNTEMKEIVLDVRELDRMSRSTGQQTHSISSDGSEKDSSDSDEQGTKDADITTTTTTTGQPMSSIVFKNVSDTDSTSSIDSEDGMKDTVEDEQGSKDAYMKPMEKLKDSIASQKGDDAEDESTNTTDSEDDVKDARTLDDRQDGQTSSTDSEDDAKNTNDNKQGSKDVYTPNESAVGTLKLMEQPASEEADSSEEDDVKDSVEHEHKKEDLANDAKFWDVNGTAQNKRKEMDEVQDVTNTLETYVKPTGSIDSDSEISVKGKDSMDSSSSSTENENETFPENIDNHGEKSPNQNISNSEVAKTQFSTSLKPRVPPRHLIGNLQKTSTLPNIYTELYDDDEKPIRPTSLNEGGRKTLHSAMWAKFVNKKLSKPEEKKIYGPQVEALVSPTRLNAFSNQEGVKKMVTLQSLDKNDNDTSSSDTESDSDSSQSNLSVKYVPPVPAPRLILQKKDSSEWEPQPWHNS